MSKSRCWRWGLVLAILGCAQIKFDGCGCPLAQASPQVKVRAAGANARAQKEQDAQQSGWHVDARGTATYTCKFIEASDAAETLHKFLGSELEEDRGGFRRPILRTHEITVDEERNRITINAPADKIARAKEILAQIDKGGIRYRGGAPILQRIEIPSGNAEALAKALRAAFKQSQTLNISNIGQNAILVYARPGDQIAIARFLAVPKTSNAITELIPLTNLKAARMANTLSRMGDKDGAYIEADTDRNAIIFRGTARQLAEVKGLVRMFQSDLRNNLGLMDSARLQTEITGADRSAGR